jgi:hypothetical protein
VSKLKWIVIVVAAVAVWDWNRAPAGDLRQFDPIEVGRLETDMWRSYYDRRPAALFVQLAELLSKQYHLSFTKSWATAYQAARAAFVFKEGKARAEYEKALPNLVRYYRAILPAGADVERAARLELEWWIIHRERDRYGQPALEKALAELQASIYGMPPGAFAFHARRRAEAMLLRDRENAADWPQIRAWLDESWASLHQAVNGGAR